VCFMQDGGGGWVGASLGGRDGIALFSCLLCSCDRVDTIGGKAVTRDKTG